jgi:hypothetical protein
VKKGPLQLRKAYLAGPMTGLPDHNFHAFRYFSQHLRAFGYQVVSPEELENAETGPRKSWEYYLKRDLRELLTCDSIAVLSGWQESRGATLEVYVGWRLGFEIFDAGSLEKVDVSNYDFSRVHNETNAQSFIRAFAPPKMERTPYTKGGFYVVDPPAEFKKKEKQSENISNAVKNAHWNSEVGEELGIIPIKCDHVPNSADFNFCIKCSAYIGKTKEEKPSENILEEANRLVGGDRGKAYGHPMDDFGRTAKIWSAILGFEVPVEKVALCMVGVKISRQCNAPKRDNFTDMAGYAMTGYMVDQKMGRME